MAGSPDFEAAAVLWDEYAQARPEQAAADPEYEVEMFGDGPETADALLELVLTGHKRATSSLVAEYLQEGAQLPRIGAHWIACDGQGRPRAVLRTVELKLGTFTDADADFARDEGEDDGSLTAWRHAHRTFWERTAAARGAAWSEAEEIVFERFDLVWPASL
ncbi:ASCH domain protein [Arthrobacter saudimassiliensis]|uniref:ASCH domain protein n=1 Tax=Arthrobacter saudimassiliensis TaxID=1461584 RepID=A0A078MR74_9MICC|nr:ASCH domain protein [Arthrobacter saudimassiliensis]